MVSTVTLIYNYSFDGIKQVNEHSTFNSVCTFCTPLLTVCALSAHSKSCVAVCRYCSDDHAYIITCLTTAQVVANGIHIHNSENTTPTVLHV